LVQFSLQSLKLRGIDYVIFLTMQKQGFVGTEKSPKITGAISRSDEVNIMAQTPVHSISFL